MINYEGSCGYWSDGVKYRLRSKNGYAWSS